jgi:hypothetical protein
MVERQPEIDDHARGRVHQLLLTPLELAARLWRTERIHLHAARAVLDDELPGQRVRRAVRGFVRVFLRRFVEHRRALVEQPHRLRA